MCKKMSMSKQIPKGRNHAFSCLGCWANATTERGKYDDLEDHWSLNEVDELGEKMVRMKAVIRLSENGLLGFDWVLAESGQSLTLILTAELCLPKSDSYLEITSGQTRAAFVLVTFSSHLCTATPVKFAPSTNALAIIYLSAEYRVL